MFRDIVKHAVIRDVIIKSQSADIEHIMPISSVKSKLFFQFLAEVPKCGMKCGAGGSDTGEAGMSIFLGKTKST